MGVEWTKRMNVSAVVAGFSLALDNGVVTIEPVDTNGRYGRAGVVELRDALSELLEMMPEPVEENWLSTSRTPRMWSTQADAERTMRICEPPAKVRDGDGDVWVWTPGDGHYSAGYRWQSLGPYTLAGLVHRYGAITEIIESAPVEPRWTIGNQLREEDLDALPVGARVHDQDGDAWQKCADGWILYDQADDPATSDQVMAYKPVILVRLS